MRRSQRMERWKEVLAQFKFSMSYIEGKQNVVADTMSRYISQSKDNTNTVTDVLSYLEDHDTLNQGPAAPYPSPLRDGEIKIANQSVQHRLGKRPINKQHPQAQESRDRQRSPLRKSVKSIPEDQRRKLNNRRQKKKFKNYHPKHRNLRNS